MSEYEMETRLEEMDRLHQDAMRRASEKLEKVKSERDRLADELVRVKQAATWDWHDMCQKAYAATGSHGHGPEHVIDAVEVLRHERDRLAAEVERLKEQILDHDCPSFSMCPKHTGNRELEECPYCTIERLTGRWAALNVKLREVYLEGLDDTGPVAEGYADGVQAALHLMAALEREEAK